MNKGDTIKCSDADDTIQTMYDLAKEGIETDFYYVDGELYGLIVLKGGRMRTLYRLVYKDGDYGAWDDDLDRIRKYAKFFHAEIEEREFKMWDEKKKGRK